MARRATEHTGPQSHLSILAGWALVPHAQAQPAKRDKRSFKLSSTAIYRSQAFAAIVSNLHVEFLLKYNAVNQLITEWQQTTRLRESRINNGEHSDHNGVKKVKKFAWLFL